MEEFPFLRCRLVALFALGNLYFAFTLVSFRSSGVCVCPVECSLLEFGTRALLGSTVDMFNGRLWTNFSIFYVAVNSNPEAFGLHSFEWRIVHSRCFWLQSFRRGLHVETWIISMSAPFLALCGGFCCSVQLEPSMMKSSSSSGAPCKLVSVNRCSVGHLWSYTCRSHLNRL